MVTRAYQVWSTTGRKWRAATPIAQLSVWAVNQHIPVLGTIGNDDHLMSDHPKDHTPFSSTQWPIALTEPLVCAIDLKNVTRDGVTLGEAIERDFRAGRLPWLKYMNHAGRHIDSRTGFNVEHSDDEHVHLSIRTDWAHKGIGSFDPWRETDDMPTVEDLLGGQVKLTEATAKRLGKKKDDTYRLDLLIQRGVIDSADAKDQATDARRIAEATDKRLIAVEAQARQNGETLSKMAECLSRVAAWVDEQGKDKEPHPAEPVKATPAAVAKKATPAAKRR